MEPPAKKSKKTGSMAKEKMYSSLLWSEKMKSWLDAGQHCDVTLVVGNERKPIKAHRLILMISSEYFEGMFSVPMSENQSGEIILRDESEDTVMSLVKYCYTGRLTIHKANVCSLYALSHLWLFPAVTKRCGEYILRHMNVETVIEFLSFAEPYEDLFNQCVRAVDARMEPSLKHLPFDLFLKILKHDDFKNEEDHVFDLAMDWLGVEEERMVHAKDIIAAVRLPLMTPEKLTTILNDHIASRIEGIDSLVLGAYRYQSNPASVSLPENQTVYRGKLGPPVQFKYTGAIEEYEIPRTGTYKFVVNGASGGDGKDKKGGSGARVEGHVHLEAGTELQILCGQTTTRGERKDTGGGGGTFVAFKNQTKKYRGTDYPVPLVVAGGGGGTRGGFLDLDGCEASLTPNGTNGRGPNHGAGGVNGKGGGTAPVTALGGGGAGYYTNGSEKNNGILYNVPGVAFVNGGTAVLDQGGFGGGGSHGDAGGGGGGGYSGGGGGEGGGGGGTYLDDSFTDIKKEVGHRGNGSVEIQFLL